MALLKMMCSTIVCGFLSLAVGCAAKPVQSGFLSSYQNLETIDSTHMRYAPPASLAMYNQFVIDPVTTKFYDAGTAADVTPEDRAKLEEIFYAALVKEISNAGFKVVSHPGPGVGRLRVAITNLKKGNPVLNIIPQTKMSGLGLGQVSAEAELVDSVSGKQIAAGIASQTGSRFSFSGVTQWGDAEAVMKEWAENIARLLKEAHASH